MQCVDRMRLDSYNIVRADWARSSVVERQAFNLCVEGSIPSGLTNYETCWPQAQLGYSHTQRGPVV